jgi:hypothetical protein
MPIDFDQGRTGLTQFLRPFISGRSEFSFWYDKADDCDRMIFWISLFDVLIEYGHPDLLRDIARQVNAQETLANKAITQELNKLTQDYYNAAKACRLGGIPAAHPDLR